MPPDLTSLGRWILIFGLVLAAIGGAIWFAGRLGMPLGRLPGDLRFGSGSWSCFVPLGTSILVSLLLTVLLNLLVRWLGK
jgi:hypothetical protein